MVQRLAFFTAPRSRLRTMITANAGSGRRLSADLMTCAGRRDTGTELLRYPRMVIRDATAMLRRVVPHRDVCHRAPIELVIVKRMRVDHPNRMMMPIAGTKEKSKPNSDAQPPAKTAVSR